MRLSSFKALDAFNTGFRFLAVHPLPVLGVVTTACALSCVGPWIHLKLGSLPNPAAPVLLQMAGLLPLDLYIIPRLMMYLDASRLNRTENPLEQWKANFEARWMRAIGAKLLMYALASFGVMLFVFPGLVAMLFLGWMPTLVLLRGRSIPQAARESARLTASTWPLIILGLMPVLLLYIAGTLAAAFLIQTTGPEPTPWQQLTHPMHWTARVLSGFLGVYLSMGLLGLYQGLESVQEQRNGSKGE